MHRCSTASDEPELPIAQPLPPKFHSGVSCSGTGFLTRWLVLFIKLQPKDLTLFCSPAYYKQNWLASDYAFKFHWRQWLIFEQLQWASEYTRISNRQLVKKLDALHHQPENLPLPACSLNCKAQPCWTKQVLHCTSKELSLVFLQLSPFYILTQVNKHEDNYTPFLWVLLCAKQIIGLKHQDQGLHKHGEQAVSQEQQQHGHCPHQPRHSATAPKQGHPNSSDQFCWQSHTIRGKSGLKPI